MTSKHPTVWPKEQDSAGVSPDIMLSEAVHARNILTTKGGLTPHEAVLGRTPQTLMIDTEETSHEALIGGEHFLDHIARVRAARWQSIP
eukprot:3616387-Amphidinium_carterae.1